MSEKETSRGEPLATEICDVCGFTFWQHSRDDHPFQPSGKYANGLFITASPGLSPAHAEPVREPVRIVPRRYGGVISLQGYENRKFEISLEGENPTWADFAKAYESFERKARMIKRLERLDNEIMSAESALKYAKERVETLRDAPPDETNAAYRQTNLVSVEKEYMDTVAELETAKQERSRLLKELAEG